MEGAGGKPSLSRDAEGRRVGRYQFLSSGARHDRIAAEVNLPPGHGLPRDRVVSRAANAAGWTAQNLAPWQYASAFWDDIRLDRVLPYREARDEEDEKHVHPLQLDVIERALVLWSNPGEVVVSPFMGVGSEVFGAVCAGRRGIGIELKPSYYRQSLKNLALAGLPEAEQAELWAGESEAAPP